MLMPARLLLVSATLTAALACGTGPDDEVVFGTYWLVSVERSSLPYLISSSPDCNEYISQGELRLVADGTYTLEFSGPYQCVGGDEGTLGRLYTGVFTRAGNELEVEAEIQGLGNLHFSGTAQRGQAEVTVPPLPPVSGLDLTLQFELPLVPL